MIEGVEIKELATHGDERGFFRELIRATNSFFDEGFAQWSHTVTYTFYITSHIYDPGDEGRIPHDDPSIGYDWTKGPEIK